MLRRMLLAASRDDRLRRLLTAAPVTRVVVARFVAGQGVADAVGVSAGLVAAGLAVSVDHLGEHTTDAAQADAAATAYLVLLDALAAAGLSVPDTGDRPAVGPAVVEVSVKLSALGLGQDAARALDHAATICAAAAAVGTMVSVDMEEHGSVEATLAVVAELRREYPATGAVLQAYLRRTEGDCRDLAYAGSRVRLCKGAYTAPASVGYATPHLVDRSYARCLRVLMAGGGYPMVATHDPRLLRLADALVRRHARARGSYEYQMLYGVRPDAQRALAAAGQAVRVYVPYGEQWYSYLVRRLAERPANVAFFLRALASRW